MRVEMTQLQNANQDWCLLLCLKVIAINLEASVRNLFPINESLIKTTFPCRKEEQYAFNYLPGVDVNCEALCSCLKL